MSKKLTMYYILDSLVKNLDATFVPLLEKDVQMMFVKDFKEALFKEQAELARQLLILFLTWEEYFSAEGQNKVVEKLYKESRPD